jgi:hypothetical protein
VTHAILAALVAPEVWHLHMHFTMTSILADLKATLRGLQRQIDGI